MQCTFNYLPGICSHSLYEYIITLESKRTLTIWLVGTEHSGEMLKGESDSIVDFIDSILNQQECQPFLDIFVEQAYTQDLGIKRPVEFLTLVDEITALDKILPFTSNAQPSDPVINAVATALTSCLPTSKEDCPQDWKHLRFHTMDLRDSNALIVVIGNIYAKLLAWLSYPCTEESLNVIVGIFKQVYDKILLPANVLFPHRIEKQLQQIPEPKLRNALRQMVQREAKKQLETSTKWTLPKIQVLNCTAHPKVYAFITQVHDEFLNLTLHLMDYYLLGRLFRSYSKVVSPQPSTTKNAVIVAGGWHIEIYRKIFQDLEKQGIIQMTSKNYTRQATRKGCDDGFLESTFQL